MNHIELALQAGLSEGQRLSLALAIEEAVGGDAYQMLGLTDQQLVKKSEKCRGVTHCGGG